MARRRILDEDRAWTSNYPPLQTWIDAHGHQCVWQQKIYPEREKRGEICTVVECWVVRPTMRLVVIVVHPNKRGWDMYTAPDTNKIDETILETNVRLGLEGNT